MLFKDITNSPHFTQLDDVSYEDDGFVMFYGNLTDDSMVCFDGDEGVRYVVDNISHNEGRGDVLLTLTYGNGDEYCERFSIDSDIPLSLFKRVEMI